MSNNWVDYATAAGTGVLAVAALWSAGQAQRLVKAEQKRHEAAQAGRVYCTPVDINNNAMRLREPSISVVNASDLPIYCVVVTVTPHYDGREATSAAEEDWLKKYGSQSDEPRKPALMPGEPCEFVIDPGVLTQKWGWCENEAKSGARPSYRLPDHVMGPTFSVTLKFQDASNHWWTRDAQGVLSKSRPPASRSVNAARRHRSRGEGCPDESSCA